jgi:hypothetical protein
MGKWGDRKYIGCGMNRKGIPDVREVCRGGDITTVISGLFSLRDRECRQNSNRENSSGFSEIRVFLLNREDEMNSKEFFGKNAHLGRRNSYEFLLRPDVLSNISLP